MGPKNYYFDPAMRTSWNQFHYEDNQILIPATIHESKSELKRLKYCENCEKRISTLPEIITFDPTIGFVISLSLKTRHQKLSRDTKIALIWDQEDLQMCIYSQNWKVL